MPSLRLSRAIEGVAETFAPPGFEILPLSLSEFMEQGPSSSIRGQVYLRGSACTIRTATSHADGRRSRTCFDTLQPFDPSTPFDRLRDRAQDNAGSPTGRGTVQAQGPEGGGTGTPVLPLSGGATAEPVGRISRRRNPTSPHRPCTAVAPAHCRITLRPSDLHGLVSRCGSAPHPSPLPEGEGILLFTLRPFDPLPRIVVHGILFYSPPSPSTFRQAQDTAGSGTADEGESLPRT